MYSEFAALAMFWFSLASTKKSEVSQRCGQRRCICTMYDVIDSLVMLFSLACIETTKTIVTSIKKLYIYITLCSMALEGLSSYGSFGAHAASGVATSYIRTRSLTYKNIQTH